MKNILITIALSFACFVTIQAQYEKARPIIISQDDQIPNTLQLDPLTIVEAKTMQNELHLTVRHGGGCGTHAYFLVSHPMFIQEDRITVFVSHDAKKDRCKALVTENLVFSLDTLHAMTKNKEIPLHIYAPTASTPFDPAPIATF